MARHAKSQLLHLQMSLLKSDSADARFISESANDNDMFHTTVDLRDNRLRILFGTTPFCHTFTNFLSIKE